MSRKENLLVSLKTVSFQLNKGHDLSPVNGRTLYCQRWKWGEKKVDCLINQHDWMLLFVQILFRRLFFSGQKTASFKLE